MRRHLITILLFVSLSHTLAFSAGVFPEIKGWNLSEKVDEYTPDNLWNKINGAAGGYLAYEFQKLQVTDYTRENGDYISVEIYEHASPVMAFGIYTSELPSDARFNNTGTQGYEVEGLLHFLADKYYVKIFTPYYDDQSAKAIGEIAAGIDKNLGGTRKLPGVISCFPTEHLRPHATTFVAQNFMGYGFLHSAFVSAYEEGDNKYNLFIIDAGSAEQAQQMLADYFKLQKVEAAIEKEGNLVVADVFNGDIPLMWSSRFIWGIQNGPPGKEPFLLLGEIKSKLEAGNLLP